MPSQGTGLTLQRRKAENEQNNDPILYALSGRFFFSPVVVVGVCDKQSTNTVHWHSRRERPLRPTQRHLLRGAPPINERPTLIFLCLKGKKRSYLSKSKPQPDTVPTTLTNFSSEPLKLAGGNMLVVRGENDTLSDSFSSL